MQTISSWDEFKHELSSIGYNIYNSYTNLFIDEALYRIYIMLGFVSFFRSEGCLWILRQDGCISHLYFISLGREFVYTENQEVISHLPNVTTITMFGRIDDMKKQGDAFTQMGYRGYSVFQRLQCIIQTENRFEHDFQIIRPASLGDEVHITRLFNDCFDPIDDEIPGIAELQHYIEHDRVRLALHEGMVSACLITKETGKTSHFMYVAVDKDQRGKKLASILMSDYQEELAETKIVRSLLWVNEVNNAANAYYRNFGYKPEGLMKQILIRRVG